MRALRRFHIDQQPPGAAGDRVLVCVTVAELAMRLSPGTRIGPYEIVAPLGAGGMGEVYRARDTKLNRDVAIKTLPETLIADPERLVRFQREAQALAALHHPNIATIFGLEDAHARPAIAMELVGGPTLAERIARGPIALHEALRIAGQIVEALDAAHERGIVHRDLKPANIKLTPEGAVKILDFGLAKTAVIDPLLDAANSPTFTVAATNVGVILGTAAYMAPEQARGKAVDKRADIWAFGCVLYEMLARRPAFAAETVTDILAAVVTSEPDWTALPEETPPRIRELLLRSLEKDPRRRLREIADASFLLDEPVITPLRVESRARPWQRHAAVPLGVALMAVSFAVGWWTKDSAPGVSYRGDILAGPPIAMGPRVSPDGQMIAFQAMVKGRVQVGLARPQSGHWTVLTSDTNKGLVQDVAWAPDNSAIYFDRYLDVPRGVYRVPALGGDPRLVIADAMTPEPLSDGSLLVVRVNGARQKQLFRFHPDTGGIQALNALLPSMLRSAVRAFPDGREAVFHGRPADQPQARIHLYAIDLATNRTRPLATALTLSAASSLPLAVAANGRELLIAQPSGDLTEILALPRDGSDRSRIVVTLPGQPLNIDAAADGSIYSDVLRISGELLVSAPTATRPDHLPLPDLPNIRAWAPRPLPLPDGRILVPTRATGRARIMQVMPDGAMAPFIDSAEEAGPPMTMLGREHVALFLGQRLVIVSSADGRIVRRLDALPGGIESIAGTPDGQTLFFVANGAAWAVAAAGGAPRRIAAAHHVALDRDGRGLLVTRQEASGVRLVRVPLDGGREQHIPVRSDIRMASSDLFSDAVGPDGRILIRIGTSDLGVSPIGLLDRRTGGIERLWPEINADIFGAWTSDGRVAALAVFTFSDLWRYTTTKETGLQ